MKKLIFLSLIIFATGNAQKKIDLKSDINQIINGKVGTVAVSVNSIEDKFTFNLNENEKLPMQSVFKFHIALAVLNQVDKGNFILERPVFVTKGDLHENTWSPLRDDYKNKFNFKIRLSNLIKYMVAKSDNNACDFLLKKLGGTEKVQHLIDSLGVKNFSIKANEEQMHKNWDAQYTNFTTTKSLNQLLIKFYEGKVLSKSSTDFLLETMYETSTETNKLVEQLPKDTPIAHKTGSSGKNDAGITGAENDAGIITLPNGKHYAISVFISNSTESDVTNCKIISDISKLVFDYLNNK